MRGARVLLYLSPLVLFLPPLLPAWNESIAWGIIGVLFRRVLRLFPWNCVMGALSYSYARQLGRDEWRWGMGALLVPFLTPLILAFMPPKPGSTADEFRPAKPARIPVKGPKEPFEERFPLLHRCLSAQPEAVRTEQRARFTPVLANFEFVLTVAPGALDRALAEAQRRNFVVWVNTGRDCTELCGAGVVNPALVEETTNWLRGVRAAGTKIDVAARDAHGRLRMFEHYSA